MTIGLPCVGVSVSVPVSWLVVVGVKVPTKDVDDPAATVNVPLMFVEKSLGVKLTDPWALNGTKPVFFTTNEMLSVAYWGTVPALKLHPLPFFISVPVDAVIERVLLKLPKRSHADSETMADRPMSTAAAADCRVRTSLEVLFVMNLKVMTERSQINEIPFA